MNSSDWVKFLSEKVFFADLEEETVYSLLHYLEDLEECILVLEKEDVRQQFELSFRKFAKLSKGQFK